MRILDIGYDAMFDAEKKRKQSHKLTSEKVQVPTSMDEMLLERLMRNRLLVIGIWCM